MIVQKDNGTVLKFIIKDDKQEVVKLTQVTVSLDILRNGVHIFKTCSITDAENGECQAILSSEDVSEPGTYQIQLVVNFENGNKFSSNQNKFKVDKKLINLE